MPTHFLVRGQPLIHETPFNPADYSQRTIFFFRYPDLQLSPAREREQIIKYTGSDGNVQVNVSIK